MVENISIFQRPEKSFKHPNMFRIGFIVLKDHKTARYATKRCQFNVEGRFLKLFPFVPISKVKEKLKVLLAKRVFPGIKGEITEQDHKLEYDRINRLRKSLWRKVYAHVGSLNGNRVSDDSVADIYNDTLAELLMEETLKEEQPYNNNPKAAETSRNSKQKDKKNTTKSNKRKIKNSKTETLGANLYERKSKKAEKSKSNYQPIDPKRVDIEKKRMDPKFSFQRSVEKDSNFLV